MDKVTDVPILSIREVAPLRKEGCAAVNLDNTSLTEQTTICPKCTKTAIKQKHAIGSFFCSSCNEAFDSSQIISDHDGGLR